MIFNSLFRGISSAKKFADLKEFALEIGQQYLVTAKANPQVSPRIVLGIVVEIKCSNFGDEILPLMERILKKGPPGGLHCLIDEWAQIVNVGPELDWDNIKTRYEAIEESLLKLGINDAVIINSFTDQDHHQYLEWVQRHPLGNRWRGNR